MLLIMLLFIIVSYKIVFSNKKSVTSVENKILLKKTWLIMMHFCIHVQGLFGELFH